ncbi:hypothetical protein ACFDWB_005115 [Salmonella enterica]|nr:hypothetical protein [Salmonella enterica]EHN6577838.1 hypothetical protein [Salmonella enterica subsp. enterica serovar Anecho]EKO0906895.1 hypothetical protein [Salmonella enterica subsp. enterica]EGA2426456.1 hypothetical protein [Salmonella enterica]EGD2776760.1 hypothetical protein [Salmonella enterica]
MTKEESQFYAGAIWAASTIYRMHTDAVVAKNFLREINDLDVAAKCGTESLRLFVMRDLPLGHDADYEAISFGPVDRHGDIICDHSQTAVTDITGQRSYGVYARRAGEANLTLIDNLDDEEEAKPLAKVLAEQLQQIKEGRYDI